ncbi:3-methyladenine DNA glycosylase [Arcanobacterium ihumii]|uniref:3-methyladenine DNA glycosylase n=1 Tax=Arcanobacterium ihumii TaxID=2138162 RepID=UPI000F546C1B|nr:3-methyladenine DNA glycosylase [Arcanobacterium ihumii]
MKILPVEDWTNRWNHHVREADARTAPHIQRRERGEKHPLEDFLWEYYPLRAGRFRTWYPGIDDDGAVGLERPSSCLVEACIYWNKLAHSRWFRTDDDALTCYLNVPAFVEYRHHGINFLRKLLTKLQNTTPVFGCLGWHEWAMAYKVDELRHSLPLRLGQDRTNAIVEQAHIRCTHFDAYQFFSPQAIDLNMVRPTYETVLDYEQPGCIHVNMDLLRACIQLGPLIPGELLLESYDLARRARTIDMAASPYNCEAIGLKPILIETTEGKAEYIRAQQELAETARPIRAKVLDILSSVSEL